MKKTLLILIALSWLAPAYCGGEDLTGEFYKIAVESFQQKDYPTALKQFEAILKIDPEHKPSQEYLEKTRLILDSIKYRRGNAKRIEKMWKNAKESYEKGDFTRARQLFASILAIEPDHQGAKDYMTKLDSSLARMASVHVNELYSQAIEMYSEGKYAEAKKYFEATTMAALKYFEAVVLDSPQRLDTLEFIADSEEKLREQRDKTGNMEREKVEARITANLERAKKFYDRGYYKAAMSELKEGKKLSADFKIEKSSDEIDGLFVLTRKALYSEYIAKAEAEFKENKFEDAFNDYSRALENDPQSKTAAAGVKKAGEIAARMYYEQGMKAFSENDPGKARESFQKVLFFEPGKKEALRALERVK